MKKLIYLIVLIVALSLIVAGCGIPVVPPSEQGETELLPNKGIINVGPGESIQAAITTANFGDIINVAAGTYDEGSLIFNNNDNITLIGSGADTTTIITSSNIYGVSVPSGKNGIIIKDLTIKENATHDGDICPGGTPRFHLKISHNSGFTLENVKLHGPGKDSSCITGLDLNTVQDVTIKNVEITGYSKNGASITAKQSFSDSYSSNNIRFEDITIDDNGYTGSTGWAGIAFYTVSTDFAVGSISLVQFSGTNTISNNPMGIYLENIGGDVFITGGPTTLSGNLIPLVATNLGDLSIVDAYAKDIFNVPVRLEDAFASPPSPPEYTILVSYWHDVNSAGVAATNSLATGNSVIFNLTNGEWYVVDSMSIQAAVDVASNGDTINVTAGQYEEQIRIKKPLTLISDTGDYRTSGTILTGDTTIFLDAHEVPLTDVTIQGFKFENINIIAGTGEGIIRDGEGSPVKNITILSNSFININNPAIKSYINAGEEMSEGWKIIDNYIENISSDGVSGMALYTLTNSTISNNQISNTTYAGMILESLQYVTVSSNYIYNTPRKGIQIAHSPNCNVIIRDNYITNTNTLHAADEGAITIYPDVTNILIEDNTLTGNYQGFTVRDKPEAVATDVYVNFNNIYGNDGFGVGNFAQAGGTLDATCNWWGAASGPNHPTLNTTGTGNAVSYNVKFCPWAVDDTFTNFITLALSPLPQPEDFDVYLEAKLNNLTSGIEVDFLFDDSDVGSATTNESGVATLCIGFQSSGVYTVKASVSTLPDCLKADALLAVYDPTEGFVTGGGWIYSEAGAYISDPSAEGKASFGFVSKYKKGQSTPTGNTEFQFKAGDLNFHSDSYNWLVIAGPKAMYKGTGTINGAGNYGFMLSAIDGQLNGGGGTDKFRIKIWDKDSDTVIYDNQLDEDNDLANPTTEIGGGQIVIHKK